MYLWEFNNYVIGYNQKLVRDQEYIVSVAYQTAAFNNSKHKPKKLEYYINKIRRSANKKHKDTSPVDVEKSKNIERQIEKLKKQKEVAK
jgi:hypothetical protein